jgi:hypothetical protein
LGAEAAGGEKDGERGREHGAHHAPRPPGRWRDRAIAVCPSDDTWLA